MQRIGNRTLSILLVVLCAWSASINAQYRVTRFGEPAHSLPPSTVAAINEAGAGAGNSDIESGNTATSRGVEWTDTSTPRLLKQLVSGAETIAFGINNVGGLCGQSNTFSNAVEKARAVYWENGIPVELPPVAGGTSNDSFAQCYDLNDRGVRVGRSTTSHGTLKATMWTSIPIYHGETLVTTNLGSLNDRESAATAISPAGLVVGYSFLDDSTAQHAILWRNGVMTDLGVLAGNYSRAWGVNDQGQVVGCTTTATPDASLPFVWQNGIRTTLPVVMDGFDNCALGINSAGLIVGQINVDEEPVHIYSRATHAAMWQDGVLTDLNTALKPFLPAGSVVLWAKGIKDSGRFIASVDINGTDFIYLVEPLYPTQTGLSSSANPAFVRDSVTFTAKVTSTGHGTPTGSVTFTDSFTNGFTMLGKVPLDSTGGATLTVSGLALGTHMIAAHFAEHDVYAGSHSTMLAQRMIFKLIPLPPR